MRKAAIGALLHFPREAGPAIPALLALLKDPDPAVRNDAFYALDQLDPQALEKARDK